MQNKKKHVVITLDGPSASGKSTVAKRIAHELGFYYLYTGLLYRAVGYILVTRQYGTAIPLKKDFNIDIPSDLSFIGDIVYNYCNGKPVITYQGKEITHYLAGALMDQPASIVSTTSAVRDALLAVQRAAGTVYDLVADGRDCGTIVFPDATVKFFVTADVQTRAVRVYNDHKRAYHDMTVEQIKEMLAERDTRDEQRAIAPLIVPEGATIIDTTDLSVEQTVDICMNIIGKKLAGLG